MWCRMITLENSLCHCFRFFPWPAASSHSLCKNSYRNKKTTKINQSVHLCPQTQPARRGRRGSSSMEGRTFWVWQWCHGLEERFKLGRSGGKYLEIHFVRETQKIFWQLRRFWRKRGSVTGNCGRRHSLLKPGLLSGNDRFWKICLDSRRKTYVLFFTSSH